MENRYVTYPHGFQSVKNSRYRDDVNDFIIDKEVESLYRSYINNQVDFNSWSFKVSVIEEAVRLFGPNFNEWAVFQINQNTLVYNHSFEFLMDTLNFINGGNRKLSPFAWRDMLQYKPLNKTSTEIANRRIKSLTDLYPKMPQMTSDVIAQWCSVEGGFEDMLTSMYLFFAAASKDYSGNIQGVAIV